MCNDDNELFELYFKKFFGKDIFKAEFYQATRKARHHHFILEPRTKIYSHDFIQGFCTNPTKSISNR